jgi:hypothetical protein
MLADEPDIEVVGIPENMRGLHDDRMMPVRLRAHPGGLRSLRWSGSADAREKSTSTCGGGAQRCGLQ